jgi:2-amino-4-hydroxy-6-hydroxymethyldihydropteridine diphosphokinase
VIFRAYIGIGSNIGDKKNNVTQALQLISEEIGHLKKQSSLYKTEPWGLKDQDFFLNAVVEIETALFPFELLNACQNIENKLKRQRTVKWGERTIDLDILAVDKVQIHTENLSIPHKYIAERNFVLVPWAEISPEFKIRGQKISEILSRYKGTEYIEAFKA